MVKFPLPEVITSKLRPGTRRQAVDFFCAPGNTIYDEFAGCGVRVEIPEVESNGV